MDTADRLAAIEDIRQARAKYWRGVDSCDGELVKSVLAKDCVLEYFGCCTDPQSGVDYLPAMNLALRGRDQWVSDGMAKFGIVSVHQGNQSEITVTGATTATGVWAFTDRMWFPPGGEFRHLVGWGHYHETYVVEDGAWKIATTRITRLRVEVHP
ncbi:MAG: nuclear transport factor 2 family protein [Sphingomonadales bacterium]|nr:nuclear transport factor 2 family protein [Sphingomonadales bacterium]